MGLDFIRAIQQYSNPVIDVIMEAFTLLGEESIVPVVFCAIYWCIDKRLGQYLAMALGASICLNGAVKDFFKAERMFSDPSVIGIISHRVETATGYSFPSGHSQTAATFWGGLMFASKHSTMRALFAALIAMVGLSRLYLGVHYPVDVAGGLAIGLVCSALFYYVIIVRQHYKLALLLCLIAGAAALCIGESEDTFKAAGTLTGILCGLYFEKKLVGFEVRDVPATKKILRFGIGMVFVGTAYIVPKLVFPDSLPLSLARYAITVFVASGVAPFAFKRLKV